MNTSLSVIVPTFRRKESLRRLVDALLVQEGVKLEIIIADQNPPGFLDGVLPEDPAIRRMMLETPNASTARNAGFAASSHQHILFIDDDLIPEKDFCLTALGIFRDYPEIRCFSPLVYNAEGKAEARRLAMLKYISPLAKDPGIFAITDTISAAVFFERDYFRLTGGFDPFLFEFARTAEDQEFFLRMQKRNLSVFFVPLVEVFHDETIPGGCELRTADYWVTREKCMRAWAFRRRIHHGSPGHLGVSDLFQLIRSAVLNREVLASGPGDIVKQSRVLRRSIRASAAFLKGKLNRYTSVTGIDHLMP
jgi:GT2 family glycosyltransferase